LADGIAVGAALPAPQPARVMAATSDAAKTNRCN
jgi:hypothetical protein